MAIPKKGTRKITVGNATYLWLIRRKATYNQTDYGIGCIHVAVEHAEVPGTTLVIYTDKGHPKDYGTGKVIPVTPSDVSEWIIQAKDLGWQPEIKGPQLSVEIVSGEMRIKQKKN
jgi:hypothetical protein